MKIPYILCHGSGNYFVMIDSATFPEGGVDFVSFARFVGGSQGFNCDGLLVVVRNDEGVYGMRMFNPDGTEAEMCGNGIRCVARYVAEATGRDLFRLTSGGRCYELQRETPIWGDIPTFGVKIGATLGCDEFRLSTDNKVFVGGAIEELDDKEYRTPNWIAVNVGNPHLVAKVQRIDLDHLTRLGKKVVELKALFPKGANVSLVEVRAKNSIFVATYERGAGLTASCGTAMTSAATAMASIHECDFDLPIEVRNRGGMVRCVCSIKHGYCTRLIGNATFEESGVCESLDGGYTRQREITFEHEIAAYNEFLKTTL